jgi:hypothetical protein
MKPAILAVTCAAALALASAAHAEKWTYYPVPGGALAYETDGRTVDISQGLTQGDALTFFFVSKALGKYSYNFMVERLEFQCRGQQYRILNTAYFDNDGQPVADGEPTDWLDVPPPGSPISVFRRLFCTTDRPPTALDTDDRAVLMAKLHALPPTATRSLGATKPKVPDSITLPATPPKP